MESVLKVWSCFTLTASALSQFGGTLPQDVFPYNYIITRRLHDPHAAERREHKHQHKHHAAVCVELGGRVAGGRKDGRRQGRGRERNRGRRGVAVGEIESESAGRRREIERGIVNSSIA